MTLSVMVISHNQEHLIKRCLDSVLNQKIEVPWEIVISDDSSTDQTWDIILQYAARYTELQQMDGYYRPIIKPCQINSSDYDPTVTSDRCAVNKANVYMHATGKYCVNIDVDDYLLGDDIYQYQILQLETHPECSAAVQNIWYQVDGQPLEKGHPWHNKPWKENQIINWEIYCRHKLFISNPAFMMRRDTMLDPMKQYGLLFDDPVISAHHIMQGKIICSERAQYVYVQYNNSIWNSVVRTDDIIIRSITPMIVELKFFADKDEYYCILYANMLSVIRGLRNYLHKKQQLQLTAELMRYAERLNNRLINHMLTYTFRDRLYIWFTLQFSRLISKYRITKPFIIKTYLLLIDR